MSTTVLKFKAGLVHFDAESKTCTPRPLKGEVEITKTDDEDMVFHNFVWSTKENIANGNISDYTIDELMLIPGDVKWIHVKSCKTGRVFALYFSSGEKVFFWMQEKNDNEDDLAELSKKDVEICERIDKLIAEKEDEEEEEEEEEEEVETKNIVQDESEDVVMAGTSEQSKNESSTGFTLPRKPIISISDIFNSQILSEFVNKNLSDKKVAELLDTYLPNYDEHDKYSSCQEKRELLNKVLNSGFYKGSELKLSNSLNRGATGMISRVFNIEYQGEGVENFLDAVRKNELNKDRSI